MSETTAQKWYSVSDGLKSQLICDIEDPKLIYDGGPWTLCTSGYARDAYSKQSQASDNHVRSEDVCATLLAADTDMQQKIDDLANQLLPALGELFPELNT